MPGFGRDARLTCKADYDRVFADATGTGNRYFRVLGRANGGRGARLGLIVSRKVDPRAVGRNRIKRLARETFRHRRDRLQGWDLVVLARPTARDAANGDLRDALEHCWRRFINGAGSPKATPPSKA